MPNRFISLPVYSFNPLIKFDDLRRLHFRKRTVLTARISMGGTTPDTFTRYVILSVTGDSFIAASKSHWIGNLHIE